MKRWAYSAALAALAALGLLLAAPALTQDRPQSTLPDIFETPPAPVAEPRPLPEDTPAQPVPDPAGETRAPAVPEADAAPAPAPDVPDPLAQDGGERSIRVAGPLTPARGGYGRDTFAGSSGHFLSALMGRIDAPLASRWAHIVLRRALLSEVPTPRGLRPADWIAERALLLLRMGEVDGAKLLIDPVPLGRFTPRLYGAARHAHLAAADVPALCPLAPTAQVISDDAFWDLAAGICAGLEGDDIGAATTFNRLRRGGDVDNIDLLLAERVTALASGIGRAANVAWEGTAELNAYRFGLATASQTEIPDRLSSGMPPYMRGWAFRSAATPIERRAEVAATAAAAGIVSARELAQLAALRAARAETNDDAPEKARLMRTAFSGRGGAERILAMRGLWDIGIAEGDRYGALIATGPAAARVAPSDALAEDAPELIESMLAAGRIEAALRWWPVLARADDEIRFAAWPLLALADRTGAIPVDPSMVRAAYRAAMARENADEARVRRGVGFLIAGLRGLGRAEGGGWGSLADDFGVARLDSRYTRRLAVAAGRGREGEVAILGAIGLQTPWSRVRPADLPAILSAFDAVGRAAEARMLAVEAFMRA